MNLHGLRWSMVAAFIGVVMLAGCSSDKDKTEAPAASTQAAPQTAAPSGESEHHAFDCDAIARTATR